jgi:sn-glycerol 3-phosphate transport system permease protein
MVEKRPILNFFTHICLIIVIAIVCLPIYIAFVASTHTLTELFAVHIPILPGHAGVLIYKNIFWQGLSATGNIPVAPLLWNSFWMAFIIAAGKIIISLLSAFAIVFFNFPLRKFCFWLIFMTLMLPVEVRILPTFEVVAKLHLINTMAGLTLPLIASATATFLFRQFYLTIPRDLVDASIIDGAGPLRFLKDILLPLSKTNMAALFIIMFIYGWNQYLWPLVATTQVQQQTIVMEMQQLANVVGEVPAWNEIMATAILAMLPPVLVIIVMQRWFVKGLIEGEK